MMISTISLMILNVVMKTSTANRRVQTGSATDHSGRIQMTIPAMITPRD